MIEVDPYKRGGQRQISRKQHGEANISAIDFSAGRGSTGVDLRWHHPKEFKALPPDQKEELCTWQKSQDGKKILEKSKASADKKRKLEKTKGKSDKPKGEGNWKKKLKSAVKTQNGFKTIMSVLAEEEASNVEWSKALASITAPPPTTTPPPTAGAVQATSLPKNSSVTFPATSLKLSTILKGGANKG